MQTFALPVLQQSAGFNRVHTGCPPEIGKVIYTTNDIESANMSLRKIIKNRGSFPSDEALLKLTYLALKNISKKWTMPIRDAHQGLEGGAKPV